MTCSLGPIRRTRPLSSQTEGGAEACDCVEIVAHEKHGSATALHLVHLPCVIESRRLPRRAPRPPTRCQLPCALPIHKSRRRYMPDEYRLTGVSMNRSSPANWMISSSWLLTCRRVIPRIAPLRNVFSRPVKLGWRPGSRPPRANRDTATGAACAGCRCRLAVLTIFDGVLFPAPFDPMIPNAVPSSTENETSSSDHNSREFFRSTKTPSVLRNGLCGSAPCHDAHRPYVLTWSN